jgi:hypothetical protein
MWVTGRVGDGSRVSPEGDPVQSVNRNTLGTLG